jgi:LysR family transcriptional activator of nhaA
MRAEFDRLVAREGLSPRIAAEADDMAMLRLLVREDAGLALVPPIVVQDELESGLLVEALPLPDLHEAFWAITLPRRFPNPALARVLPTS